MRSRWSPLAVFLIAFLVERFKIYEGRYIFIIDSNDLQQKAGMVYQYTDIIYLRNVPAFVWVDIFAWCWKRVFLQGGVCIFSLHEPAQVL